MYVDRRLLRTKFLPLFCSGVGRKAGITLGRLMKFSRYGFPKKKIPPTQYRRRILSGETDGKMNRVCCGAVASFVDFSFTEVVGLTVITNHFCRRFVINLQVQWDL